MSNLSTITPRTISESDLLFWLTVIGRILGMQMVILKGICLVKFSGSKKGRDTWIDKLFYGNIFRSDKNIHKAMFIWFILIQFDII